MKMQKALLLFAAVFLGLAGAAALHGVTSVAHAQCQPSGRGC